ncbi:MAG: YaaR family protein [Trichlorobacter sp.]|jgi:uncharacterized protein YaaR (DUF327 family)|nr:YaaR family protein [Trichlorobacter sp.]
MRINERQQSSNPLKRGSHLQHPAGESVIRSLFAGELKSKQHEAGSYQQDIEILRQKIDQAGSKLEQEPTLANFRQFRELLGVIAKRIGNEAYKLEKVGGTPMDPRYFEVIKVIDHEADKLYGLIMQQQKDRMAITAAVVGIKGLVVDLTT